jgi:hypothetical protein
MCAEKFPLVSMGGRADRQACADGERGPPSARAEIISISDLILLDIKTYVIYISNISHYKLLSINTAKSEAR